MPVNAGKYRQAGMLKEFSGDARKHTNVPPCFATGGILTTSSSSCLQRPWIDAVSEKEPSGGRERAENLRVLADPRVPEGVAWYASRPTSDGLANWIQNSSSSTSERWIGHSPACGSCWSPWGRWRTFPWACLRRPKPWTTHTRATTKNKEQERNASRQGKTHTHVTMFDGLTVPETQGEGAPVSRDGILLLLRTDGASRLATENMPVSELSGEARTHSEREREIPMRIPQGGQIRKPSFYAYRSLLPTYSYW